jgi:hypothetical protein
MIKISGGASNFAKDGYAITTLNSKDDNIPYKMFKLGNRSASSVTLSTEKFTARPRAFTSIRPTYAFTVGTLSQQYLYATLCSSTPAVEKRYLLHNVSLPNNSNTYNADTIGDLTGATAYIVNPASNLGNTVRPVCPTTGTMYTFTTGPATATSFSNTAIATAVTNEFNSLKNTLSSEIVVLDASNLPDSNELLDDFLITVGA